MPDNDKNHKENKTSWCDKKTKQKNDGSWDTNLNWVVSKGLTEKVSWNWVMNYKNASPPPQPPVKDLKGIQAQRTANANILTQKHVWHVDGRKRRPAWLKHNEGNTDENKIPKALKNIVWNLDFIRLAVIEIQNVTMTKECKLCYK